MTRFTELLMTGEVHSAYEDDITTTSVEDTAPASVEDPVNPCLLYTSPSPRDKRQSRMPSSA